MLAGVVVSPPGRVPGRLRRALLRGLRLPGPDEEGEKLLRLDPLRSDLDRRRHVTLQRLCALEVPYAILADQGDSGH